MQIIRLRAGCSSGAAGTAGGGRLPVARGADGLIMGTGGNLVFFGGKIRADQRPLAMPLTIRYGQRRPTGAGPVGRVRPAGTVKREVG